MRILTRKELKMIMQQLPLANKEDTPENVVMKLPQLILKDGEIWPAVNLMFKKFLTKNFQGTQKWGFVYCGPLPYFDDEIIIEKKNKVDLEPTVQTNRIVLPS